MTALTTAAVALGALLGGASAVPARNASEANAGWCLGAPLAKGERAAVGPGREFRGAFRDFSLWEGHIRKELFKLCIPA